MVLCCLLIVTVSCTHIPFRFSVYQQESDDIDYMNHIQINYTDASDRQKVKASHTRYRVLGPELILVYR